MNIQLIAIAISQIVSRDRDARRRCGSMDIVGKESVHVGVKESVLAAVCHAPKGLAAQHIILLENHYRSDDEV